MTFGKRAILAAIAVSILPACAATIALRLLVVDSPDDASRILKQLQSGADFAVLAREKSIDATATDGGFLGQVDPGNLRPELRQALQGLAPGSLSPIVKLPSGYAVLKVLPDSEVASIDNAGRARQAAIAAAGAIRYTPDIDGQVAALAAMPSLPKAPGWDQDLPAICEVHQRSYSTAMDRVNRLLDPADEHGLAHSNGRPYDWAEAHYLKAQLHANAGEMTAAIEQLEAAYKIAQVSLPESQPLLERALGIGYIHLAEMENDVYHHPGDRCLFPMQPGLRYTHTASSEKAVQYLLRYLARTPGDIEVQWLLNVAEMTLGNYPDRVPPPNLIPPSLFASPESIGRFTDVAPQAGLNLFARSSGVIVDDFDNDGLLDVLTSSYDACAPMHFYHNNGDGTFSDRTAAAGLSSQLGGLNLVAADYNNDGCLDVLVLRGAWEQVPQRKSLLRNNCDGTFTDVTKQAGLASPGTNSQSAAWADINNDGLLDLFVASEGGTSQLFLNKGDGTFQDISHAAGIDRSAVSKGVTAADYDHDGYMDFYVSNVNNTNNFLYHNNHDGTFTDVAEQAGVPGTGRTFAVWFFDYDNDGWPDLFVTSYFLSVEESLKTYLGLPHNAGTLKLYKNLGNGTFRDVTKDVGLDKVFLPMGANFGDFDNDGYPDIYLGTGSPSYASILPNVMLHNKQGKSFTDITASSGTGDLHKGHGIAIADLDNDGSVDILTSIGGAAEGDNHTFRLFQNPGNANDWIALRLVGVKSNRSAIGARIKVTVKNEGADVRAVYATVGSRSSFGGSPLRQHIGLGKSAEILKIEITWPSGIQQTFTGVAKNQLIEIRESAAQYTKLPYQKVHLGGTKKAAHYAATALILEIDRAHKTFIASCKAIPGYMDAMVMPIPVHDAKLLDGLQPSAIVDFTLTVTGDDAWAENLKVRHFQSLEEDPFQAHALQLIENPVQEVKLGEPVPGFTLTSETGAPVSLSQFKGKVVAASFVYTSCPLPNYCFRLSNNFGRLQKRFAESLGRDLVLLSITIDPVRDTPEVLARYAATFKADSRGWHFLTGPETEIRTVSRRFGVNFWPSEGTLTHSLHTVVIGRDGKLAANLEGNEFTAEQLGDLVSAELQR